MNGFGNDTFLQRHILLCRAALIASEGHYKRRLFAGFAADKKV